MVDAVLKRVEQPLQPLHMKQSIDQQQQPV
jgi:hypothetical protein